MTKHTFRQGKCIHCGLTWFDLWSCNERGSEVGRLKDLVVEAAAVAPRQAAKIEARARRLIDSERHFEMLQDESFGLHESLLAEGESAMHDLRHTLAPITNSPPSKTSGDSEKKSEGSDGSEIPKTDAEVDSAPLIEGAAASTAPKS